MFPRLRPRGDFFVYLIKLQTVLYPLADNMAKGYFLITCSQTTRSAFRRILVRLNEEEYTQKSHPPRNEMSGFSAVPTL